MITNKFPERAFYELLYVLQQETKIERGRPIPVLESHPRFKTETFLFRLYLRWKMFREQFLDDLPPQKMLPSDNNYYQYKCRFSVFLNVANTIDTYLEFFKKNLSDQNLITEMIAFEEYVRHEHPIEKTNPLGPNYTTSRDIEKFNNFLDRAISALAAQLMISWQADSNNSVV